VALLKNDPLVKDVPISGYIVRSPRAQLLIASMMSRQARSTKWPKLFGKVTVGIAIVLFLNDV